MTGSSGERRTAFKGRAAVGAMAGIAAVMRLRHIADGMKSHPAFAYEKAVFALYARQTPAAVATSPAHTPTPTHKTIAALCPLLDYAASIERAVFARWYSLGMPSYEIRLARIAGYVVHGPSVKMPGASRA